MTRNIKFYWSGLTKKPDLLEGVPSCPCAVRVCLQALMPQVGSALLVDMASTTFDHCHVPSIGLAEAGSVS